MLLLSVNVSRIASVVCVILFLASNFEPISILLSTCMPHLIMNRATFTAPFGAGSMRIWSTNRAQDHVSVDRIAEPLANTISFRVMYHGTTQLYRHDGPLWIGANVSVTAIFGECVVTVGRAPRTGGWRLASRYTFRSGGCSYSNEVALITTPSLLFRRPHNMLISSKKLSAYL